MCLSLSRQSIYFNLTLCQRCLKFNINIIRVMKLTNSEFFIVNFIHLDECIFVELEWCFVKYMQNSLFFSFIRYFFV